MVTSLVYFPYRCNCNSYTRKSVDEEDEGEESSIAIINL